MCTSTINTWIYACRHHYWNIQCCDLTVFQLYFTTFLIETGYEEPIKITNKMLKSHIEDGSFDQYKDFFYRFSWISSINSSQRICYRSPSLLMCRMSNWLRAVGVWTDDNHRFLLCELEDGVAGNTDSFLVINKGSPTRKYINDVIDHVEEAGIYMQFKKRCVPTGKLAKTKISLRPSTDTFISMSNICRWRSVSYCWDMQWQLCAWLRKSRVTTWCQKAGLHKCTYFAEEYTHSW